MEMVNLYSIGAPGRIRTCGTRIRNPVLYPTELREHICTRKNEFFRAVILPEISENAIFFSRLSEQGISIGQRQHIPAFIA